MSSALGVSGIVIPSPAAAGGVQLYTTIVTNTAELVDALENNRGDTFIVAGDYDIDTDTVGPMDTTPRLIRCAGASTQVTPFGGGNGVNISFSGAGGSITALDFSAGLTEDQGVVWEGGNLVSDTASLLGFLTGVFGVRSVRMNAQTLTSAGVSDSLNVEDCTYVNPPAGGLGFFGCDQVMNCQVGSKTAGLGAETGFFICEQVTNCSVFYEAGSPGGFTSAFQFCNRLTNCVADYQDVTGVGVGGAIAFNGCNSLPNRIAIGPTIGSIATLNGFATCTNMDNCDAARFAINFDSCRQMGNCDSVQGVLAATGQHFQNCAQLDDCFADGTGDAALTDVYVSCTELTGCESQNATGVGFLNCTNLGECIAENGAGNGFETCLQATACESNSNGGVGFFDVNVSSSLSATSNTGNGFEACSVVSVLSAIGNTGFGYASNVNISNATGVANTAGLTDTLNAVFDPVTCPGFP